MTSPSRLRIGAGVVEEGQGRLPAVTTSLRMNLKMAALPEELDDCAI
jgi:hypothetical protein